MYFVQYRNNLGPSLSSGGIVDQSSCESGACPEPNQPASQLASNHSPNEMKVMSQYIYRAGKSDQINLGPYCRIGCLAFYLTTTDPNTVDKMNFGCKFLV